MNISSIIMLLIVIAIYSLFWTIVLFIIALTFKNIFSSNKEEIKQSSNEENNNLIIESKKITSTKEPNCKKNNSETIKSEKKQNEPIASVKRKKTNEKQNTDKNTLQPAIVESKNKVEEKYNKIGNKNDNYSIEYIDEENFRKKERAIKKYNMLAYKKLIFDYYPSLREGNFQGNLIPSKDDEKIKKYELILPTEQMFIKVHGNIILHYTVYIEQKKIILENITPEDILTEGSQKELTTYKGVLVSKSHKDTDMFKINLLNMLDKK